MHLAKFLTMYEAGVQLSKMFCVRNLFSFAFIHLLAFFDFFLWIVFIFVQVITVYTVPGMDPDWLVGEKGNQKGKVPVTYLELLS